MKNEQLSAKAKEMVAAGAALIDVRTPAEFAGGHVEGARNIPLQALPQRLAEVGPPEQPVVVYCQMGGRSAKAADLLRGAGYKDVFNLGPITNW